MKLGVLERFRRICPLATRPAIPSIWVLGVQIGGRFPSFIVRNRIISLRLHLKDPSFYNVFSHLRYIRLSYSSFFGLSLFVLSATVASKSQD